MLAPSLLRVIEFLEAAPMKQPILIPASESIAFSVMALVDYPDSDLDNDDTGPDGLISSSNVSGSTSFVKRKRDEHDDGLWKSVRQPPPALPSTFHSLYANSVRTSTTDDPDLHSGRHRQIPHMSGNWPSFVYLEWLPSDHELSCLDAAINEAVNQLEDTTAVNNPDPPLKPLFRSSLGVRLPLHISLSSPLILSTANKDDFEHDMIKALHKCSVFSFGLAVAGLRWVHNFDKSRYFLILTMQRPSGDELQGLLSVCNSVVREYGLPELYSNDNATTVGIPSNSTAGDNIVSVTNTVQNHDKFHISIGWTLEKPDSVDEQAILRLTKLEELSIQFSDVRVKIGNRISTISLESSAK